MIRTSIKRNKYLIVFVSFLLFISLIMGIIYVYKSKINISSQSLINSQKLSINTYRIIFLILISISSYLLISPLIIILATMYEGFSLGVNFFYYTSYFNLKGLLYEIIDFLLNRSIFIIILIILLINNFKLLKLRLNKNKPVDYYKSIYFKHKMNVYLTIIVVIKELILSSLFTKITNYFSFLIK